MVDRSNHGELRRGTVHASSLDMQQPAPARPLQDISLGSYLALCDALRLALTLADVTLDTAKQFGVPADVTAELAKQIEQIRTDAGV